jgi:UDP-glucose 4-epimerase
VHVSDFAVAYPQAIDAVRAGEWRLYNVGSGSGVAVNEVLAAVERVTGHPVRRVSGPAVAEPRSLVVDSQRIRAELGWRPARSTIERIIADAWHWSRAGVASLPDRVLGGSAR